jgi:Zn-dependent M28 family amino/carboxypeptidase
MGSHVFARELRRENVRVDLMIALDLVGYYSDEADSQGVSVPGLGLLYPDRGNFIAVVGDLGSGASINSVKRAMLSTGDLPVHSFRAPSRWAPVLLSDHWAFRKHGMPGVLVTDTAFLRYPYYHTPADTPERLDYVRMAELVQALHGLFLEGP